LDFASPASPIPPKIISTIYQSILAEVLAEVRVEVRVENLWVARSPSASLSLNRGAAFFCFYKVINKY
jgi:hypothetical protein